MRRPARGSERQPWAALVTLSAGVSLIIVDATIVAAPSSTKNQSETRDPEMHQTQKGKQWYFGMKVHAGMDRKGIVHTVTVTPANTADITELPNLLHGEAMQRRFHAEPIVRAAEALLQERIPQSEPAETAREAAAEPIISIAAAPTARRFNTPATAVPFTHLLSNGRYSVMLTNAGGGASSYDDLAVTRWRGDATRDGEGSFIYIRDARSGAAWSAAYQPTRHGSEGYQVTYSLEKAEYRQRVADLQHDIARAPTRSSRPPPQACAQSAFRRARSPPLRDTRRPLRDDSRSEWRRSPPPPRRAVP